jgi:transcriptional regulator with XRE-family HTH domain
MRNKLPKNIVNLVVRQLIEIRKAKKLSHETVARLSELHRSTISLIEARKCEATLLTYLKIATALDCNLGQLIVQAEKECKKTD